MPSCSPVTSLSQGHIIPILKGQNKDPTNPANYRGITLLPVIALLLRLTELTSKLSPLQGGFRPGLSCLHTAFVFYEAVCSIREWKMKAYVALLDVKKAFDTVWHAGLLVKLFKKQIPLYIWHILDTWYGCSTSAESWNSCISRGFTVKQGVRQGAILSPLLYSVFVNDLLDQLRSWFFHS